MKPKGLLLAYYNGDRYFNEDIYPIESYKFCIDYCVDYNKDYEKRNDYVKLFLCVGKSGLVLLYDESGLKEGCLKLLSNIIEE